ncbi:MAG: M48 family metallopeptidase [Nanoarchaeota archaeon]
MKTDFYAEIAKNKANTYLLLFFFSAFIIFLGWLYSAIMGGSAIIAMIVAFIIAIVMILINYYTGDKTVLAISHAKPVTKKDDPFLINTVEGLSIAAGIPMPKVYIIEETSINAFATGRDPEHASIAVTTGARKRLNRTELEGVIAHEMSHVKNYDIRYMMLVAVLVGVIVLFSDFMLRMFLFGGGRRDSRGGAAGLFLIILALVLAILAPIFAQMIRMAISRKREFLADATGAQLTRYPPGLAGALKKIRDDHDKVVDTANKATAHLYIENPLRNAKGFMNSLFSTHPDVNERIKRLESM